MGAYLWDEVDFVHTVSHAWEWVEVFTEKNATIDVLNVNDQHIIKITKNDNFLGEINTLWMNITLNNDSIDEINPWIYYPELGADGFLLPNFLLINLSWEDDVNTVWASAADNRNISIIDLLEVEFDASGKLSKLALDYSLVSKVYVKRRWVGSSYTHWSIRFNSDIYDSCSINYCNHTLKFGLAQNPAKVIHTVQLQPISWMLINAATKPSDSYEDVFVKVSNLIDTIHWFIDRLPLSKKYLADIIVSDLHYYLVYLQYENDVLSFVQQQDSGNIALYQEFEKEAQNIDLFIDLLSETLWGIEETWAPINLREDYKVAKASLINIVDSFSDNQFDFDKTIFEIQKKYYEWLLSIYEAEIFEIVRYLWEWNSGNDETTYRLYKNIDHMLYRLDQIEPWLDTHLTLEDQKIFRKYREMSPFYDLILKNLDMMQAWYDFDKS